jgi:hypothetical protein
MGNTTPTVFAGAASTACPPAGFPARERPGLDQCTLILLARDIGIPPASGVKLLTVKQPILFIVSLIIVASTGRAQEVEAGGGASSSQVAQNEGQPAPGSLSFVRTFSSADDVRPPSHPALDHAIDIIAGPKDPVPRVDALQSPSAVTVDSHDRVFVADPGAKAVHVFDFVRSKYAPLDGGSDRLRNPVSLAVDGQDNLYVIEASSRTVLV